MKGLLFGTVLSVMTLGINGAWALEMQPGEWQLEMPVLRVIDPATGKIVKEDKLDEPSKRVCYTESKVKLMQTLKKGTKLPVEGCNALVSENSDTEISMDSRCPTTDGAEIHTLVKYIKVSDKELTLQTSMQNTKPGKAKNIQVSYKQTFVSSQCSDKAVIE